MKRNVDLTENRLFSNNNQFNELGIRILTIGNFNNKKLPWWFSNKGVNPEEGLYLNYRMEPLVVTGNKTIRKKAKEYFQSDNPNYCDCCGRIMNLKPWNREIGVCHNCLERWANNKDKCKWR